MSASTTINNVYIKKGFDVTLIDGDTIKSGKVCSVKGWEDCDGNKQYTFEIEIKNEPAPIEFSTDYPFIEQYIFASEKDAQDFMNSQSDVDFVALKHEIELTTLYQKTISVVQKALSVRYADAKGYERPNIDIPPETYLAFKSFVDSKDKPNTNRFRTEIFKILKEIHQNTE